MPLLPTTAAPSGTAPTSGALRRRLPEIDGAAVVALGFFAGAVLLWLIVPLSDDEGILALMGSTGALQHPTALLLAQKFRPAGTLLNLPAAALGWEAYVVWHIGLASTAALLLGRVAQRWGGSGVITALVVATSPAFITAAVSGQSNSDALVVMALGLYLLVVTERPLVAGLVFGALPWVRYEYLPFAILIAIYSLVSGGRHRRIFYGMTAFPTLLLLAGAAYHRDVLWWFTYPPTLLGPGPESRFFDGILAEADYLARLPGVLLQVTPVWALPLLAPWHRMQKLERLLLVALGASFALMVGVPFLSVLNFEHSPRYVMVVLPFIALAVGRVASVSFPLPRSWWVLSAVAILLTGAALLVHASTEGLLRGATIAVPALVAAAAHLGGRRMLVIGTGVSAAMGLAVLTAGPSMNRMADSLTGPNRPQLFEWLETDPRGLQARAILTNDKNLHLYLRRRIPDLAPRVHLLHQFDSTHELYVLLNKDNGQHADVMAGIKRSMYGIALWPCEVAEVESFEDTLLVIDDDYRFLLTYPQEFIDSIATEVTSWGSLRLYEGRAPPPEGYVELPLGSAWMRETCQPSSKEERRSMSRTTSF